MPLPDNHFFEVEWEERTTLNTSVTRRGIVLEWGAPYGATAITIILRDNQTVVKVKTDELKVTGIVDIGAMRAKKAPSPVRQITLRR